MTENEPPANRSGQKTKFLVFGYKAAIILSFIGILASSAYLFLYLIKSNPGEIKDPYTMVAYNAERKMVLISTAIFVAMSFGFLGFALFLINAKGEAEGSFTMGTNYKIDIARLSPGLFVILCATSIIIIGMVTKINYTVERQGTSQDRTATRQGDSTNVEPFFGSDFERNSGDTKGKRKAKDTTKTN